MSRGRPREARGREERSKPYDRTKDVVSFKREERYADAKWRHDKHPNADYGLQSRLSEPSAPGLRGRMSGRELMEKPATGVELFPGRARSSQKEHQPNAALVADSLKALSQQRQEQQKRGPALSIIGAARTVIVRVEQLVQGTTAEDVELSFAEYRISSAKLVSAQSSRTATVEVEVASRANAENMVSKYNGVLADGERLKLSIVEAGGGVVEPKVNINERIGKSGPARELLQDNGSQPSG